MRLELALPVMFCTECLAVIHITIIKTVSISINRIGYYCTLIEISHSKSIAMTHCKLSCIFKCYGVQVAGLQEIFRRKLALKFLFGVIMLLNSLT